jgi:sirohydrochlorin ferrochelatase
MAGRLSALTDTRVELAFAATGRPSVVDAVCALRRRGARRVAVASYLLSDGLFQDRLQASGADVVTEPLGTHPATTRLVADRFRSPARADAKCPKTPACRGPLCLLAQGN